MAGPGQRIQDSLALRTMFSSTACRSLCLILEGLLKKGGDVAHVPWEATAEWTNRTWDVDIH